MKHIIEMIQECDADEFEQLLEDCYTIANNAAQAEPKDPAWRDCANHLNCAARAVHARKGN